MEVAESKENLATKMDRGTDKMSLILVVVALLVAVVALIIACVGVSQKGGATNVNVSVPGADSQGGNTGAQTGKDLLQDELKLNFSAPTYHVTPVRHFFGICVDSYRQELVAR